MKPLYDKICEYVAKNPARFHMPAHFGTGDNPLFSSAKYDVTELDFSDNLQNPTGAILESEKRMRENVRREKLLLSDLGQHDRGFYRNERDTKPHRRNNRCPLFA